ncbi:hypothetical protein ONZ45_g15848 [Pleurotus djamor]|nr:hypothetical protein ONZ45_g15848 [Pleurotus djamor]
MSLPIGLLHLLKQLPAITAPSLFTFVVLKHGFPRVLPYTLPGLFTALASVLATPLYILLSSTYRDFNNRRAAAKANAVLPTSIEASWGGLSTAKTIQRNIKTGYPGDNFKMWSERYGNTFAYDILTEHGALLATQFDEFEKGPATDAAFNSLLGTGVFNSDGERWKFHRSMTRPFFSKDRISHFDIFDRHAEDALHQAAVRITEGYPVDFQDMVSRFTLDSATEFLFDQDVGSLSAGLDYPVSSPLHASASSSHPSNAFAEAFLEGQVLTSLRTVGGRHWPLFEWSEKVRPQREIVNRYIDPIISKAIQRHNTQEPKLNGDEAETLLEHLVRATQDHKTLQDEILNIMIAGRDTTACTLTYAVYMLAENPHVLQKLRDEVLSKIGASKRPDFDDLCSMRYLRAFINETLRLYPPVPFDMRATKVATTLPPACPGEKPFFIPQDRNVLYSVFLMHRRTDLWGPDAAVFDPDRFLDERHKRVIKNPYRADGS